MPLVQLSRTVHWKGASLLQLNTMLKQFLIQWVCAEMLSNSFKDEKMIKLLVSVNYQLLFAVLCASLPLPIVM